MKPGEHPSWYDDAFLSIVKRKNSTFLIGTERHGLIKFDPINREFQVLASKGKNSLPENAVTSIVELRDGKIITGHYDNGLTVISADKQHFTYLRHREFDETSLSANSINHIYVDRSGLMWISTHNGVSTYSYLQTSTFLVRKKPDGTGLSGNFVYDVAKLDSDNVLLATSEGLDQLRLSDGEVKNIQLYSEEVKIQPTDEIWGIEQSQEGSFWIVSGNGLHKFNAKTQEITNYLNGPENPWQLPQSELYTIESDDKNTLWITGYLDVGVLGFSETEGIIKRYFNDPEHRYTAGGNFTIDKVLTPKRELWLASTDGVYRLNLITNEEQHISVGLNDMEFIRATSITQDEQGAIWVATQGAGLVRLDVNEENEVESTRFTTQDGLPSNELLSVNVYKDKIWLTSKNQLFSFSPETSTASTYPSLIDIPDISFIEGSSFIDGRSLYLGTNKGLLVVKLNIILTNRFKPNVQITDVIAGSQSLLTALNDQVQKGGVIAFEDNNVTFSFASLDFTNSALNQYQYMLEGFDKQWISAGNKTSVTYNNLDAGKYQFKVKGSNSDGKWSDKEARFDLTIEQSWLFYVLWLLTALLITGISPVFP